MSPLYDLHAHSTASDGTLSPEDLVERAVGAGVTHLALTDHDSTDGVVRARATARRLGLELIAGVEISVTWQSRVIHIVGLHVDIDHPELQAGLASLRAHRDWRAEEIARKLEKAGIDGALQGASEFATGPVISRTHFARFLVRKGLALSVRDVFKRYLVRGKPGYVAGTWASLADAVGWIRAAGGVAVVAHPARYDLTGAKLRQLLTEFRDCGGCALEVISGSHGRDDVLRMSRFARELDLAASAGSDYHGPENPWVDLGRLDRLPDGLSPIWALASWPGTTAH